jgi:hypothetical protein
MTTSIVSFSFSKHGMSSLCVRQIEAMPYLSGLRKEGKAMQVQRQQKSMVFFASSWSNVLPHSRAASEIFFKSQPYQREDHTVYVFYS